MGSLIPLKSIVAAQVESAFKLFADIVCVGDYYRTGAALFKSGVHFLVYSVPDALCDGTMIKAGDCRLLVRVSEIGSGWQPASGDYVDCGCGSAKYDIICGVMDGTNTLWTLYGRRRVT